MSGIQREIFAKQVALYSVIALLAAFTWFVIGLRAWRTYHTDIAFQTFIAFSAIACIAITLLANRERPKPFLVMVQAALFFSSAMHTGFAIDNLYSFDTWILSRSRLNLFNDLLELALLSCLLFISVWSNVRCKKTSNRRLYAIAFALGTILMLTYAVLSNRIIQIIPESLMHGLGVIVFGTVIILLGATSYLVFQSTKEDPPYQPIAFIVFCVLLAASAVPLIIPLFQPSVIWTLSVTLQSVAFFVLYLSLAIPYLQDAGMKPQSAAIFASGFSALFLIPFIVTLIVETLIPGFYDPDLSVYIIVHMGAASLSAVMALLTYGHAKTRGQRNLYPLILLFASWTVVDAYQVVMSQLPLPYAGESMVPYITGSIISLIALYLTIRWTMDKPPSNLPRPELWPLLGVLIQTGLVILSEMIQTVEVLLTGFLALWIVPNILKANFLDWTAGWYSAELILLVALLFGPAVLSMLYLGEMRRAESSHQRARVYSDLLVHDISNYHQAILISLGLLEVEGIQTSLREQVLKDAQIELHRADELIRNVRQIGLSEEVNFQNFEYLDLVQCIRNSYENAIPSLHRQSIEFSINRNLGECYVQGHRLIEGIFTNLLRNSIQYSPDKKRVEVELELGENEEGAIWIVRVIDYGQGIEPEQKAKLFNRFMSGAKGTGLGLSVAKTLTEVFGGSIAVEDRVPGDYSKGSVFIITLPVAP